MRLAAACALALLPVAAAGNAVPRPITHPLRVMSLSACTDQLVLALVPPARITSVTWLARDPSLSLMTAAAARVGVNHGLAEEVLRDRPDLVVAGTFTSAATRAMLRRLGWPMIEVGPADDIAAIRATTRQVARAVDAAGQGEALLARMDRQLAQLARRPAPLVRVAAWDGGGFGAARGTLFDALLTMVGATNVAADTRAAPDTEALLAAAPPLLVRGGGSDHDLRATAAQHPLVRRWWAGRTVVVPQAAHLCGTPFVADAALRLRADLRAATAAARAPLPFAARSWP